MGTTRPVWISAAAALVTAGGVRVVAPVWLCGPKGDAFTKVLQSLCARATFKLPKSANADKMALATIEVNFMIASLDLPVQLNPQITISNHGRPGKPFQSASWVFSDFGRI